MKLLFIVNVIALFSMGQSLRAAGCPVDSALQDTAAARSDTGGVRAWRLALVAGGTLGTVIYSQYKQSQRYWGQPAAFHVMSLPMEYKDALLADKFGHACFTSLAGVTQCELLRWTGMDSNSAQCYGSAAALLYQTAVEVQDGFSGGQSYLGFSIGDMFANLAGAALPVLQISYPWLRPFNLKISVNPFQHSAQRSASVLDDYESTYHWLSVRVADLIPSGWRSWYPSFLGLAIGHSVKGLDRYGGGQHEFYISLDWDLQALPGDTGFLRSVKRILNQIKLPAPCIRILPHAAVFGLRW